MRGLALLLVAGCGPAVRWDPAHPQPGGPPAPPLRAPDDHAVSEEARPRFRWRLPAGEDRAMLELCADKWCRDSTAQIEVRGASAQPPSDLPSGELWWRVRGLAGATMGPWGEPRKLSIETKVGLGGRTVDVVVPPDQRVAGERLIGLAERSVALDVALLGAGSPEQKSRLYFYATDAGLGRANQTFARGLLRHHQSFSGLWGSHVRMWPTLDRGSLAAYGETELAALHELAHAVSIKTVRLFTDQPAWWREGTANLLAVRGLVGDGDGALTLPIAAGFYREVRALAGRGKLIPLAKMFNAPQTATNSDDEDVRLGIYAEAFTLLDFLDSGERRARFRSLVHEIEDMRGFLVASRLNQRLLDAFGPSDRLERDWLAFVRERPIFPFTAERGRVRALPGGGFVVEARPRRLGLVRFEGGREGEEVTLGAGQRIELDYEAAPMGAHSVAILVGERSGPWLVELGKRAAVISLDSAGTQVHQTAPIGLSAVTPGVRHRVAVFLDGDALVVTLDGGEALRARDVPFGGRWGAGCFGGQVIVHELRVVAAPAPTVAADPGLPSK